MILDGMMRTTPRVKEVVEKAHRICGDSRTVLLGANEQIAGLDDACMEEASTSIPSWRGKQQGVNFCEDGPYIVLSLHIVGDIRRKVMRGGLTSFRRESECVNYVLHEIDTE